MSLSRLCAMKECSLISLGINWVDTLGTEFALFIGASCRSVVVMLEKCNAPSPPLWFPADEIASQNEPCGFSLIAPSLLFLPRRDDGLSVVRNKNAGDLKGNMETPDFLKSKCRKRAKARYVANRDSEMPGDWNSATEDQVVQKIYKVY